MTKNNKVVTYKQYDLAKTDDMASMANVLKTHIVKHNLYTNISGKNYAHVEGWQFAGGLMGIFPKVVSVPNLSSRTETKWQAEVEIVNSKSGQAVSTGFAICSNKENKKKNFDEYAVLSMAQTRAIGKAYRNLLGWVMKLAGYEGTPSEEMVKVGETPREEVKTVDVPVDGEVIECQGCASLITPQERDFSKKMFKKQLCRNCQKEAKKK